MVLSEALSSKAILASRRARVWTISIVKARIVGVLGFFSVIISSVKKMEWRVPTSLAAIKPVLR